jgi:multidrug resistance efflux pump
MTPQRWAFTVIGVILAIALLYVLMNYYTPYTGDAYVQRYVVQVSPLVSGRVTAVHVTDNARVRAGDPLFELDARPFEYDLRQAESKLALARQAVAELKRDVTMADAVLQDSRELQQTAQTLFDEMKRIRESGAGSFVEYITAVDRLETRKSTVREAEAALDKTKLALEAILDNEHALIRQAEAEANLARWRLEQTRVAAPGDGYVTNLQLQPGASIPANAPVMTYVDGTRWWVIANFNENAISRVRGGQQAEISLRSVPGRVVHAHVDSLGWGVERGQGLPSGALPSPDTSQVWIRPPQRLPVKLIVESSGGANALDPPVGASVAVTIYTGRPNPLNSLAALWQRVVSKLDFLY